MPTSFQKVNPSRVWIPGEEAAAVAGSVRSCSCATGNGGAFYYYAALFTCYICFLHVFNIKNFLIIILKTTKPNFTNSMSATL